jgi:hypothetical protein
LRILDQVLGPTLNTLHMLAAAASGIFKSRVALQLENLALRHRLCVLQRSVNVSRMCGEEGSGIRILERMPPHGSNTVSAGQRV